MSLDVDKAYRRMGLGTSLMDQSESELLQRRVRKVFLQVDQKNPGAIAFYLRLGYAVYRELPHYYGPGRNGFLMVKEIMK